MTAFFKRNVFVVVAAIATLAFSQLSFAKPSSYSVAAKGDIGQGHFLVSGSSGLGLFHTNYDGGGSSTVFDLQTTTAYFVDYGFGIGGTVGFRSSDSLDLISMGPTVVYYLVANDRIGVPVTGSLLFQHYNRASRNNVNLAIQAGIGFQYFISSSLAVGPAFQFRQIVGDTEGGLEIRSFGVLANFTLFL